MQISIFVIKVNAITNIGSLNIGKTILCRNQATQTFADDGDEGTLTGLPTASGSQAGTPAGQPDASGSQTGTPAGLQAASGS